MKNIPIFVIKDYTGLSSEEFWPKMEKEEFLYPYTLENKKVIPGTWNDLEDDPNYYFALLSACEFPHPKFTSLLSAWRIAERGSYLYTYPLWFKIGRQPFIEFKISDALNKVGVKYEYSMGDNPPEKFVERVRKVLRENMQRLAGLKLIANKTNIDSYDSSLYLKQLTGAIKCFEYYDPSSSS